MRRGDHGFTLLEVMVALAIVAIGLIAAFNGIIQMAHSTSFLRERALADWIAMNEITQIRISGNFPDVGRFDGDVEFAGRNWRWEAQVSDTGVEGLRRIDMSVAYEETPRDAVTIVTGFVSQRTAGLATQIDWWGAGASGGEGGPEGDGEEPGEDDRNPRQRGRDRDQPPVEQPEEQEE
jgi:general secretion pathway protein I